MGGTGGGGCEFLPQPTCTLKNVLASAFAYKSKAPLLPADGEFEQMSVDSFCS